MSNENNYEFNNEERGAHEGQSGHGAKRPYNRQKNYKYKSQHRNNYNRKSGLNGERKQQPEKEKTGSSNQGFCKE